MTECGKLWWMGLHTYLGYVWTILKSWVSSGNMMVMVYLE